MESTHFWSITRCADAVSRRKMGTVIGIQFVTDEKGHKEKGIPYEQCRAGRLKRMRPRG